jgi:nucleoside-diphosphate-sugar epimerase
LEVKRSEGQADVSVLVTGASGLVGANVCRLLIERGHTARALVRSRSGTEPLAAMGAELADGDVTDADSLRRAASGMDAVVHSAALIGGPGQDRDAVWQVNALGTRSVLDLVPDGRTVVIGTVDLYAGCSETIDEKTPFRDVYITDANRAEIEKVFGPSLLELSERSYPDPYFDDTYTRDSLGVSPTPLREGLSHFIEWARQQGQVEGAGDGQ